MLSGDSERREQEIERENKWIEMCLNEINKFHMGARGNPDVAEKEFEDGARAYLNKD